MSNMSSPIDVPKPGSGSDDQKSVNEESNSEFGSPAVEPSNTGVSTPERDDHEDSLLDSNNPAIQRTIGQSIAAFMRSFSPLSIHDSSSPILSSSPSKSQGSELAKVGSPSASDKGVIIGTSPSRSASPSVVRPLASSSNNVLPSFGPRVVDSSSSPEHGFQPIEEKSDSVASPSPSRADFPVVVAQKPSDSIGGGTLLAASSASNLAAAQSSGVFSVLGSFFSKKEIVGSFNIELGTSIKVSQSETLDYATEMCPIDSDGFVSTHFEINKVDLSNVDHIIVDKLMMLFREAQRRLPSPLSVTTAADLTSPLSGTSAPGLLSSLPQIPAAQSSYAQSLTSGMSSSSVNLNSKMESAIEWTLQARPLGYAYKGIGKLLRKINIISKAPFDLHLTHVPLFLHSVPQLEFLTLQHHAMPNIPAFTFYISSRLTKVILSYNKIKTLFTEVPKATLAGIINPGTQASYVPPERKSEDSTNAGQVSDPVRKTDLLEHLSSSLSYFAALDPPPVQYLDLSENLITIMPTFIGYFRYLETLNLAKNQLSALPVEMSSLPSLTDLIVDNNYIYDLPALPALTKLSWRSNGLKAGLLTWDGRTLLPSLATLPKLTHLDLSFNSIDQIPTSLLSLSSTLKHLAIANNALYNLNGEEMAKFTSLSYLNLATNRLKTVPAEIFKLPLSHLDLSENQLQELPVPLNSLATTLTFLSLAKNQIKSLPLNLAQGSSSPRGLFIKHTEIQQFDKLRKLDLSNNKFSELPDMFEELGQSLTNLDVSNNLLTTLPASSAALASLLVLNLSNNKIDALPTIGLMRSLELVDLQGNDNLTVLPRTFVELHQLKELMVAQTKMSRSHTHAAGIWKYDVQTMKPMVDKLFVERVPQLLSLARSATHSLLLSAVHFLCKNPIFHPTIIEQSLHYTLLSNAKCVPCENEYDPCFNVGQEKISSLIAMRHLSKNMEVRPKVLHERPLIAILSEHVLEQASLKESADPELYDAGGHQLGKSASSAHLADLDSSSASDDSSPSSSHSNLGGSSNSNSGYHKASRSVQLHRLQNKIRISLTGLCLDIMCYLSWSPELRDAMNETDGLTEAVKKLKHHPDHELAERSRRTLAGLGVAPEFKENRGVRILTLDGGGTKGFTAVVMLKRLEDMSGRRIHELFDLMVGTSTGALIATLASWTRLTMAEAVIYYREACGIIFAPRGTGVLESKYTAPVSDAPQPNSSQGAKILSLAYEMEPETFLKIAAPLPKQVVPRVKQALKMVKDASPSSVPLLSASGNSISSKSDSADSQTSDSNADANAHPAGISANWTGLSPWARIGGFFGMISSRSFYDSAALEMVLKNLGDHQATMLDTAANGDLRLIFTSTDVGVFPPQSYLLRNYSYKHDSLSKYDGTSCLKMWEAMRCSTAAPAYFDGFTANGHRLADGGVSTNNPTGIAVQEAKALWPDKPLDVVLSVGVGLKPTKPCAPSMSATFTAIVESCTETEQTHAILEDLLPRDVYFRLQPVDDVFDFPLDETKIEKLDAAQTVLNVWMDNHEEYFRKIVDSLLANRVFDDSENALDAELKYSPSWSGHAHHPSRGHLHRTTSYEDSDDDELAPSPLRPIPRSASIIMDNYSPLDDLQQWEDDRQYD